MIEYVMLAGVNDQRQHAEEIVTLLKGLNVVVAGSGAMALDDLLR